MAVVLLGIEPVVELVEADVVTDIHFCVERRAGDGPWHRLEELQPNPFLDPDADDLHFRRETVRAPWYDGCSYDVFAALAGVRSGGDVEPIAAPRGLPADCSDETRQEFEGWGADAHTPSWLSTAELLDYDWDQRVQRRGWIYLAERSKRRPTSKQVRAAAQRFVETGRVSVGYAISRAPVHEWDGLPGERGSRWKPIREQVELVWHPRLSELVVGFLPTVLRMARACDRALESVRTVFWFDN